MPHTAAGSNSATARIRLHASLACADFRNLESQITLLSESQIDSIHIDIMDGTFVPNFGLNFDLMKTVRGLCNLPQDCHLMVVDPERFVEKAVAHGADSVAIHVESTRQLHRALHSIRDLGARSGVVLNPATPLTTLDYILDEIDVVTIMTVNPGFAGQAFIPAMLKKIRDCRTMLDRSGFSQIPIQVDGNVSFERIPSMVKAGATLLVGGTSSIFDHRYSIPEAVTLVRQIIAGLPDAALVLEEQPSE